MGITDSKGENKLLHNGNYRHRKERKYVRETALQTPKSEKKVGQAVLQIQEQRFPGNPWRSTGYQRPTRNLGRTPHQRRWIPKGDCDPLGSRILAGAVERGGCAVAGLLAGPVTLQGPTLEQSAPV